MSEALKFVPPRVAIIDSRTGLISREWYLFFQGVFDRIGGPLGEGNADLSASMFEDAGIEEIKAAVYNLAQVFGQDPPIPEAQTVALLDQSPSQQVLIETVQDLVGQVQELRDQLAEVAKELQAIKQSTVL